MTAKPLSAEQVLDRLAKYCAYQERCIRDVVDRMNRFDLNEDAKKEILHYLTENRFVDDERFAKCFVQGKINQNGWGIHKIRFQLTRKGIAREIIDEALKGMDEALYRQRLRDILTAKAKTTKANSDFEKRKKLSLYAIQKGFEPSLVFETVRQVVP